MDRHDPPFFLASVSPRRAALPPRTAAEDRSAGIAVMHLDATERARDLVERLRRRLPDAQVISGEVGAVIGSHVGPGMVAVVVSPVRAP